MAPTREMERQREAEAEQLLLRRLPSMQIVAALSARWGVNDRTVWKYMARVRARWEKEATEDTTPEGRQAMRANVRRNLDDLYAKALGRRIPVTDSSGKPVLDPQTGQPLTVERPDVSRALGALRLLVDLDALALPAPPQQLAVTATVAATVAPEDAAALAAFLTRMAADPAKA